MNAATLLPDAEAPAAEATEATRSADAPALPSGFAMRRDGLYWFPPEDDAPVHVCGPLTVAALTHDGDGRDWGCLLQWLDGDGRAHEWAMPRAMLAGDGTELRGHLLSRGLFVAPGRRARERLAEYLMRSAPAARVRVVGRLGWHAGGDGRRVFVLPDETLGAPGAERVMVQTERPEALPPLRCAGTLEDWQRAVAALAVDNARLAFAIGAALAAPLLGLLDAEGGGFHLRGPSSLGKSTALHVADSVWGGGGLRGWARSWRSTDNALEAVAAAHNDLLLCLDEMGECEPAAAAAAAYMLANGCGKGRAARDGGARRVGEWRTLFLSSGEVGLGDRLAEARGGPRRLRAGQEVRVLDIPAEAGPHGLFETLHGHASGAALADALRKATRRCYGTAGRAWVAVLAADPEGVAAQAREVMGAFLRDHLPAEAGGQARRAAGRVALVAAAGELATPPASCPGRQARPRGGLPPGVACRARGGRRRRRGRAGGGAGAAVPDRARCLAFRDGGRGRRAFGRTHRQPLRVAETRRRWAVALLDRDRDMAGRSLRRARSAGGGAGAAPARGPRRRRGRAPDTEAAHPGPWPDPGLRGARRHSGRVIGGGMTIPRGDGGDSGDTTRGRSVCPRCPRCVPATGDTGSRPMSRLSPLSPVSPLKTTRTARDGRPPA
jgi:putative DNA primase/helicase